MSFCSWRGKKSNKPFFFFPNSPKQCANWSLHLQHQENSIACEFYEWQNIGCYSEKEWIRVVRCDAHASEWGKEQGSLERGEGGRNWSGEWKVFARLQLYEPGFSLFGGPDSTLDTPIAVNNTSVTVLLPHPGQTSQINHRVFASWAWNWLQNPSTTMFTEVLTSQQVLPLRVNPSAITASARSSVFPVAPRVPWQPPCLSEKPSISQWPGGLYIQGFFPSNWARNCQLEKNF